MNKAFIAKFLIILGLFIIIVALLMDTSYRGTHNLSLAHQQMVYLIVGGFIFFNGLLMKPDNKNEEEYDDDESDKVSEAVENSIQFTKDEYKAAKENADKFYNSRLNRLKSPDYRPRTRVLVGLFVGFVFMVITSFFLSGYSIIFLFVALLLAMRDISIDKALKPLLYSLSVTLISISFVLFSLGLLNESSITNESSTLYIIGVISMVIGVVPIFMYKSIIGSVVDKANPD